MHFAVFVKSHRILLQSLSHHLIIEHKRFPLIKRLMEQIQDIEQFASIPSAKAKQGFRLLHPHLSVLENGVGVDGVFEQLEQIFFVERLQHIHLCARKQWTNHFKRRIFGGGTNEGNRTVFHSAE